MLPKKIKRISSKDLYLKSECAFFPLTYVFSLISGSVRKALRKLSFLHNSSPLYPKYYLYFYFFFCWWLTCSRFGSTLLPLKDLSSLVVIEMLIVGEKSFSWEHGSLPFSSKDAGGKDQLIENLEIKKTK